MGDFNMTLDNPNFCFKSINPTCIDNFLTSKKTSFIYTLTFETGISDHHKLIGTMLRSTFAKGKSKKIFYRCYKNPDNEKFEGLKKHLSSVLDSESFHLAFKTTLDRFAPLKQNVVRNNNQAFMTKTLRKAIMKRSN